jgi:hypothetical protein
MDTMLPMSGPSARVYTPREGNGDQEELQFFAARALKKAFERYGLLGVKDCCCRDGNMGCYTMMMMKGTCLNRELEMQGQSF